MFTITSFTHTDGYRVEEILGTDSLATANRALARLQERWPQRTFYLNLSSRSDAAGNRFFPTTVDGDRYTFPPLAA